MKAMVKRFMQDEQGLETVEYAILMALVVAALVTAIIALRGGIESRITDVTAEVGRE